MENILDFDLEQLQAIVTELGEKKFRAEQIFGWLAKGVASFDDMKNVSLKLRSELSERYYIGLPKAVTVQESATDGTKKILFEEKDGSRIESVFMKYRYGNSICISSQVGCRMGCKFCASTRKGLERSLTAGEMYGQVLAMCRLTGEHMDHIVVMGIGEPFDNYDNLSEFIKLIHDPKGYGLSMRNITVSTCGLIPMIDRFGSDFDQVNLAVSLHAPNGSIRKKTMPVAKKYDYDELLEHCWRYTEKTHRRITFEYALVDGLNNDRASAEELAGRLKGHLCHVNLIPLNRVDGTGLEPASMKSANMFEQVLGENEIAVTIRRRLGADIDAACGQLRLR